MKPEIRNPNTEEKSGAGIQGPKRPVGCVFWASGFGLLLAALARRHSGSDFGFRASDLEVWS
jgi:hypothetical protein